MKIQIEEQFQRIQIFKQLCKATSSREWRSITVLKNNFKVLDDLWFEIDRINDEISVSLESNCYFVEEQFDKAFNTYDEAVIFYYTRLDELNNPMQHQTEIYQSIARQKREVDTIKHFSRPDPSRQANSTDLVRHVDRTKSESNNGFVPDVQPTWSRLDATTKNTNLIQKPLHQPPQIGNRVHDIASSNGFADNSTKKIPEFIATVTTN